MINPDPRYQVDLRLVRTNIVGLTLESQIDQLYRAMETTLLLQLDEVVVANRCSATKSANNYLTTHFLATAKQRPSTAINGSNCTLKGAIGRFTW